LKVVNAVQSGIFTLQTDESDSPFHLPIAKNDLYHADYLLHSRKNLIPNVFAAVLKVFST
jgi:hypothetical protein